MVKESAKRGSVFKKNYERLQEIVGWFEKEEFDLEEGIEKFEEGAELVKELKSYLEKMENKVKELKAKI